MEELKEIISGIVDKIKPFVKKYGGFVVIVFIVVLLWKMLKKK